MTQLTAILKPVHFLDVYRAMEFELTSMGQIKKKRTTSPVVCQGIFGIFDISYQTG